jgi:hypothetical protein
MKDLLLRSGKGPCALNYEIGPEERARLNVDRLGKTGAEKPD